MYVKAPASYFCYTIDTPYLMNLASKRYIVEMYGEENGRYVTYEDIFGQGSVG